MKHMYGPNGKKSIWMKNIMNESLSFEKKNVKSLSFNEFSSVFDVQMAPKIQFVPSFHTTSVWLRHLQLNQLY